MILRATLLYFTTLSVLLSKSQIYASNTNDNDCFNRIDQELGPKLSSDASIAHYSSALQRWSTYQAPRPGTVINVANENDVVETVKYCIENNLDFLAQSGGHAWATTFNIHQKDVLINMRGLNHVTVNDAKDQVTFGGGTLISELAEAAYQNQVETTIPSCSCVGMGGAGLGGGFNRLMGRYGFVIDNILSVNLVTADAELITVSADSYPDLWWAVRGAGANFGIVTSVTMKTYPPINNGHAWVGNLFYSPDQLEDLVQTLNDFELTEEMTWFLFLGQTPPASPSIIITLFYAGSEADALAGYKPLYDLGPVNTTSEEMTTDQVHHVFDPICPHGFRRPAYTAGLKKMDPKAFREIWNELLSFVSTNSGLNSTNVLIESYSPKTMRAISGSSTAFPHREMNFLTLVFPAYKDSKLDPAAAQFGKKVRGLWQESSGFEELKAYINYAHGDEDLTAIYGENLPRLKEIKKIWDKNGRFSQFFPIPTQ